MEIMRRLPPHLQIIKEIAVTTPKTANRVGRWIEIKIVLKAKRVNLL
jgi:hypothetical protein